LVELYFCKRLQTLYGTKINSVNKFIAIIDNMGETAVSQPPTHSLFMIAFAEINANPCN